MSTQIDYKYRQNLLANAGCVYLPNDEWWKPERPLLPVTDEDIWSYVEQVLRPPEFRRDFSTFMHSVEARGDCGSSGDAWADFIVEHLTYRSTGDFFDWQQRFYDRLSLPGDPSMELSPCHCLGAEPRRTMNRLKDDMDRPAGQRAQKRHLPRLCAYAWVWKSYLARAGRPEFCEDLVR